MRLRYVGLVILITSFSAPALVAQAGWFRDEAPPPNAKPLSSIVKTVEDRGYRTITEVEFENGKWEIEIHQPGGKEKTIHVDAFTSQIVDE